jgi:small subunit ribosomal protein S8
MDKIADMLTMIRNGYMASKSSIIFDYSNFRYAILKVLQHKQKIGAVEVVADNTFRKLKVVLLYDDQRRSAIRFIQRVSKQSARVYIAAHRIKKILDGFGFLIISTSSGVMTGDQARQAFLGGEVICEVH